MFIIREIFHLHFGHYREVKALVDEALQKHLLLQPPGSRILTDFTGEGYRFILELPFATLADYEKALKEEMGGPGWTEWYSLFKPHVRMSEREIMKQVN